MTITHESIRAAGGIVHRDGNIFFTSLEQLRAAIAATSKPIVLSNEVREYLQEGISNSFECDSPNDPDYAFAEEMATLLGPIYTGPVAALAAASPAGQQPVASEFREAVASLVLSAHNVGQAPMSGTLLAKLGQHAHVVAHMLAAAPDVAAVGEGVPAMTRQHVADRFDFLEGHVSPGNWRRVVDAAFALAQQAAPAAEGGAT